MNSRFAALMAIAVALAGFAGADETELEKAVPPAWGTATYVEVNLHAFEFVPIKSDTTYDHVSWYKFLTGGYPAVVAGVHLPSGARLGHWALSGCDESATGDNWVSLWRCPVTTQGNCAQAVPDLKSSGSGGCTFFGTNIDLLIENAQYSYYIEYNPDVLSIENRFRHVELYYLLQVSPAPVVATFADVPTSHPYFRFVEALYASGITGGCGGGNYCPNNTLTRGEMAVFLSAALGLHWGY